jgi:serine/threonine protein kinase
MMTAKDDEKRPFWTVRPEDVFTGMDQKLGAGGGGTVWKCNLWHVPVAVKYWESGRMSKAPKDYYRELKAGMKVRLMRHPNVVSIIGRCSKHPGYSPYIVFELAPSGSLDSLVYHKQKYPQVNMRTWLTILRGVASGMEALHSVNVIHRDLKSMNVLLGDNYRSMITDFGVAREVDQVMTSQIGTMLWMAPEIVESQEYLPTADSFSYGLIVYEVIAGSMPRRSVKDQMNGHVPPLPPALPVDELYPLYNSCCDVDPTRRPPFDAIVKLFDSVLEKLDPMTADRTLKRIDDALFPEEEEADEEGEDEGTEHSDESPAASSSSGKSSRESKKSKKGRSRLFTKSGKSKKPGKSKKSK